MACFIGRIFTWVKGPFLDFLWPRLVGEEPAEPKFVKLLSPSFPGPTEELEDKLRLFYSSMRESGRTVDARLVGLLTLSSVVSAIAAAGLLAALNLEPSSWYEGVFAIAVTLVVVYVLAQSCRCLLAAVAGLRRHSYRMVEPSQIISTYRESIRDSAIRWINEEAFVFSWNNWVEERKVDQLELAYVAYRNGLCGALMFFFLVASFASWKIVSSLLS